MKKLIVILLLLCVSSCLRSEAQSGITAAFPLVNLSISPVSNRTCQVANMTMPNVNSSSVVIGDVQQYPSDSNGVLWVTNCIMNTLYAITVTAPPSLTKFKFIVPTNAISGSNNATSWLVADSTSTFPAGQVAYAAAASDVRYALVGSTPTITNAAYVNSNNVFASSNHFNGNVVVNGSGNNNPALTVSNTFGSGNDLQDWFSLGGGNASLDKSGNFNASGTVSANIFTGSGSGLTSIPSSQLTGALPAISGLALTGVVINTNGTGTNLTLWPGAVGNVELVLNSLSGQTTNVLGIQSNGVLIGGISYQGRFRSQPGSSNSVDFGPHNNASNGMYFTAGVTNAINFATAGTNAGYVSNGVWYIAINGTLTNSTTGNAATASSMAASGLTGTVAIANGGTGSATGNAANLTNAVLLDNENGNQHIQQQPDFVNGLYSIGATSLANPASATVNWPNNVAATSFFNFHANTNLMSLANHADALIGIMDWNPFGDYGIKFPMVGTNNITPGSGSTGILGTNSDGVKVYLQDSFGPMTMVYIPDANNEGELNQAGSFAFINDTPGVPIYFSVNTSIAGDTNAAGNSQHPLLIEDTSGLTNSTKFVGWHFPMLVANAFSFTNKNLYDAFNINQTNGNASLYGALVGSTNSYFISYLNGETGNGTYGVVMGRDLSQAGGAQSGASIYNAGNSLQIRNQPGGYLKTVTSGNTVGLQLDDSQNGTINGTWTVGSTLSVTGLTTTKGINSTATNTYSMTSGGYTNSGTKIIQVFELTGTSIVYSNTVSGANHSLGSPASLGVTFLLKPGCAVTGTGCAVSLMEDL